MRSNTQVTTILCELAHTSTPSALKTHQLTQTPEHQPAAQHIPDTLVHDNTDGALGDVVHDASLAVVELVGHTLVDGAVGLHIHNVTSLVHLQAEKGNTQGRS